MNRINKMVKKMISNKKLKPRMKKIQEIMTIIKIMQKYLLGQDWEYLDLVSITIPYFSRKKHLSKMQIKTNKRRKYL